MKIVAITVPVPHFIKTPFAVGDWVVYENNDSKMLAEVKCMDVEPKTGRIKILGIWGNYSVMTAGDKGWQYADHCRLATEEEQYWEERRRVFAKKKRRNNEFRSGDFVTDDHNALTVLHQDKDTGVVTVYIINSGKRLDIEPQDLEILFFAEDAAG
ncbi:TPA: hypothetical protein ACQUHF_004948 [Bacillus paranthracis]|uniref:Uncharacterized protein n=1 Tax=Bacillus cereus (strain Q1) TaxID=361100 RepID=B9J6M3_BACCQ|nr:hypothetical protein [Bacillus paranthracis]ACM16018.1 hypothetical protein BCQ_PT56 [Bacillus cereus Q1]MCC2436603.1 hypothetical protein [Bacillus paranthracis]